MTLNNFVACAKLMHVEYLLEKDKHMDRDFGSASHYHGASSKGKGRSASISAGASASASEDETGGAKGGLLHLVVPLCHSKSARTRLQALWILGNLSTNESIKSLILTLSITKSIVKVTNNCNCIFELVTPMHGSEIHCS